MFLALKELKHGKLRFMMIGFIIVLISWLVFILSGLGNGLSSLSAATLKNMDTDYVVYEKGAKFSFSKSLLSASMQSDLEQQANVQAVAPFGSAVGSILKHDSTASEDKVDIAIIGIEPGTFIEPAVIEGSQLNTNNALQVVANDTLKKEGFQIGDILSLDGSNEKLEIVGFTTKQTFNHLPAIYTTLDKWRAYSFAAPESNKGIADPVNAFILQGSEIDSELLNQNFNMIETATKKQAINGMPGYTAENGTIMMMLVFLLVISAFVIAVFFYVLTMQKTHQFGVMKAIGSSSSFIAKAIVSQVFTLSFISIIAGIGLTYVTAAILPEGMPFALEPSLVVIYGIILLVISILSSLLSVRKITKIDPLTAIGRVE